MDLRDAARRIRETLPHRRGRGRPRQADVEAVLRAFLALMSDELCESGGLALRGFGTFRVVEHRRYHVITDFAGQPHRLAPRRTVRFRPGSALQAALNDED